MMNSATRLLDQRTILLVDANPNARQLLTAMFRDHGCKTVHHARGAREALDLLDVTRGRLDLVVAAADLPPTGGLGFVKAVRSGRTPALPGTPCVLFHSSPDAALKRLAVALDVSLLFSLPVSAHALCSALAKIAANQKPVRPPADYAELAADWAPAGAPVVDSTAERTARQAALSESRRRAAEEEEECLAVALGRATRLAADLKGVGGTVLMKAGEAISPDVVARLIERGNLDQQSRLRVLRAPRELDKAS